MVVSREADGMRGRSYTNEWWAPKYVWEDIDLPSQVDTPGGGHLVVRVYRNENLAGLDAEPFVSGVVRYLMVGEDVYTPVPLDTGESRYAEMLGTQVSYEALAEMALGRAVREAQAAGGIDVLGSLEHVQWALAGGDDMLDDMGLYRAGAGSWALNVPVSDSLRARRVLRAIYHYSAVPDYACRELNLVWAGYEKLLAAGGKMKSTTEMVEEAKEIDVQDAYGRFHSVRFETMHGSSPGLRAVFS